MNVLYYFFNCEYIAQMLSIVPAKVIESYLLYISRSNAFCKYFKATFDWYFLINQLTEITFYIDKQDYCKWVQVILIFRLLLCLLEH